MKKYIDTTQRVALNFATQHAMCSQNSAKSRDRKCLHGKIILTLGFQVPSAYPTMYGRKFHRSSRIHRG